MRNSLPSQRLDYAPPVRPGRRTWPTILSLIVIAALLLVTGSVLLPMLNRNDHKMSPRVWCASNLRQFGLGATMYANEHKQAMPDDLQTLFDAEEFDTSVLVCPSSKLRSLRGATTQAADAAIVANQVSYIYLGKGLTLNAPADTVLMYEPLGDHGDGINVLFVDAHVEWLDLPEATKLIARIASGQNPVRYPDPASTQP